MMYKVTFSNSSEVSVSGDCLHDALFIALTIINGYEIIKIELSD